MEQNQKTPSPAHAEAGQSSKTGRARQTLGSRVFWFFVGAGVNYLLISQPFAYLRTHTDLSVKSISECSMGVSVTFFFLWNYFINFRGNSRRRDALVRYLVTVLVMWKVSSMTLSFLKNHDFLGLRWCPIDLDVVTTQVLFGGFKFLLYHFWVFPASKKTPPHEMETAAGET